MWGPNGEKGKGASVWEQDNVRAKPIISKRGCNWNRGPTSGGGPISLVSISKCLVSLFQLDLYVAVRNSRKEYVFVGILSFLDSFLPLSSHKDYASVMQSCHV